MRDYAAELDRAADAAGDPGAFATRMAEAQAAAKRWRDAFEEIRSRGYATYTVSP